MSAILRTYHITCHARFMLLAVYEQLVVNGAVLWCLHVVGNRCYTGRVMTRLLPIIQGGESSLHAYTFG